MSPADDTRLRAEWPSACITVLVVVMPGYLWKSVKVLVAQSCLTLCNTTDCSPPGSSLCGILQARILEQVAIPFSRRTSWSRDQTQVSYNAGGFFTVWATREALFVSIGLPVLDISCKWNLTSCGLLWLVSSSRLRSHSVFKIYTL